jgi:hypothetical protein
MCNTRDLFSVTFDRSCGRKVYCGTRLQLQGGYLPKIKHILGVKLPIGRYIGGVKCIFPKKNESLNLLSRVIMFLLLLLLLLLLLFYFILFYFLMLRTCASAKILFLMVCMVVFYKCSGVLICNLAPLKL